MQSSLTNTQLIPAMPDTDDTAIRPLLDFYEPALNNSDSAAATKLYHSDGAFMPMGFPTSTGDEQIHAAYSGIFNTIQLSIRFTIEEIEIHGDVAFAGTRSRGSVKVLAENIEAPEQNRELFVFRKANGNWAIYRQMFNKMSN